MTCENYWGVEFFKKMVDLSIHKNEVRATYSDGLIPLLDGRVIHLYNHRASTFSSVIDDYLATDNQNLIDLDFSASTKFFVADRFFEERIKSKNWKYDWFLSFRDISNATNERTGIFAIRPRLPATDKLPTIFLGSNASMSPALISILSSFVYDFCLRQKVGGVNVGSYILEQTPVLPPSVFTSPLLTFITPRVLELIFTAHDLSAFAHDLGYVGRPFTWNDDRRFWLRAELDALYFILYGIERADVEYIMETFPIVKRKDVAAHGTYRTKEAILSVFDDLTALGLERLPEYRSQVPGGDVAGGWAP